MAPRVNIPPATMDVKLTSWPTREILPIFPKYMSSQTLKPGHHKTGEGKTDGQSDPGDGGEGGGGQADVNLGEDGELSYSPPNYDVNLGEDGWAKVEESLLTSASLADEDTGEGGQGHLEASVLQSIPGAGLGK